MSKPVVTNEAPITLATLSISLASNPNALKVEAETSDALAKSVPDAKANFKTDSVLCSI